MERLNMDRSTWLKEMRDDCEAKYDTRWASQYSEKWGLYSNITHLQFLEELLSLLPQSSTILDAPCGAGRYLPYLLEKKHAVIAIDQSQGMLARAQEKFPEVQFEKIGLQEMNFREVFDGAICIDAMENVSPEDWPGVLSNFHRALKRQGVLYFTAETIEMADENEIKQAYEKALRDGLPVVYGECPDEGVYHYHPTNQQVREWVKQAGFEFLKEGNGELWYYHILLRKAADHKK
jgi:cyclopropane fatty-acyl-phospholipid synthase-like methyltransferase